MWAIIDYVKNGQAHITIFKLGPSLLEPEEIGNIQLDIFSLQWFLKGGRIRDDDYLAFSPQNGFSRFQGGIVYDKHSVPERYRKCASCHRSLWRNGLWRLEFGKDSGDAYHRKCLRALNSTVEAEKLLTA